MQIIEGEREIIQSLYNVIRQDPRHEQVTTLEEGEQTGKNFPDWAMAFKGLAAGKSLQIPEYIDLEQNQMLFNEDSQSNHLALPHLKKFYQQINSDSNIIQI